MVRTVGRLSEVWSVLNLTAPTWVRAIMFGPRSVQGRSGVGPGSVHAPHAALKHGHTGPCEVPHASGEESVVIFRWSHGPHMDRRNTAWTHGEMSHGPRNQWYHVWDPPRTDRDFWTNLVVKTRRLHRRVHVIQFPRVHVGSMWSLRVHVVPTGPCGVHAGSLLVPASHGPVLIW